MRRSHQLIALASLVLLGATACSSDEGASATIPTVDRQTITPDVSPKVTEAADTTTVDAPATADTLDPALVGAGAGTPFCELSEEMDMAEGPLGIPPAEVEEYYRGFYADQLDQLSQLAPPELADDVALVIDRLVKNVAEIESYGWDIPAMWADPAGTGGISPDEYTPYFDRVHAYCDL